MDFEDFAKKTDLFCKTEIERIKLVAFFETEFEDRKEFDINSVLVRLNTIGAGVSNTSRIKQNLTKSRDFRKNNKSGNWILNANIIKSMQVEFKEQLEDKNSIESNSELLDEKLFSGKRSYLDKLIIQVNNTYSNHCYDAYHFYQENKDVALLQCIFNHSAPSVTLRYIGINQDIIDSRLNAFCL